MFEVLSGQVPFAPLEDLEIVRKVIGGGRPERPEGAEGAWFTDDIWGMLEQCWSQQPKDRPSIEAVLECLERVSAGWQALPPRVGGDAQALGSD